MKVSIIVPVYRAEAFIEKCAYSLLGQSYGDVEYIFVNDNTPDNSMVVLGDVIDAFADRKDRVAIIDHKVTRGPSAARNTGLENASGEYILFVDSDDYLEMDAVELLVEKASDEDADMIVFDSTTIYRTKKIATENQIGSSKQEYVRRLLWREASVAIFVKFVKKDIYIRHGVRFDETINYGEDYVISAQLAYFSEKTSKLDKSLYNYVKSNSGSISANITTRSVDDIIRSGDLFVGFFENVPDADKYTGYLPMMKLRNKIDLLKVGGTELRKEIIKLYPEIDYRKYGIPIVDRMVLYLAEHGRWGLLDFIVDKGLRLKHFLGIK